MAALSPKNKATWKPCRHVSPRSGLISTRREQLESQTPGLLLNHRVRRGKGETSVGFSVCNNAIPWSRLLLPPRCPTGPISLPWKTMDRASLTIYTGFYNCFVPVFLQPLNCISNGQTYMCWLLRILVKFLCWILIVSNPQPQVLWQILAIQRF